jgi:hypothetical protein
MQRPLAIHRRPCLKIALATITEPYFFQPRNSKKCLSKIRFEIKNQSEILKIMSYEELKKEVVALSFKEQKELSALLFSLWRKNNSEESLILERRVQDRDERNWVSLEDFAIQTQGQGA